MRGSQFLTMVTMLRDELGRTTDVAVSTGDVASLKRTINRNYEALYADYDWPHLRQFATIPLLQGERYYDPPSVPSDPDIPAPMDYDRIEEIAVRWSGLSYPVERGIDANDYNSIDSEEDERNGPVLKWDVRFTGDAEQIEVWPIPDTNDQKLHFTGFRKFTRLVNDGDICLLDDNLVVLFSAAELLARQESKDAGAKASAAQALYSRLKGRTKGGSRFYTLGGHPEKKPFTLALFVR